MRIEALTADLVQQAVDIYQDIAYGTHRPRRVVEPLAAASVEQLLQLFQKEKVEPVAGHACCRYTMRLGNRNYPFMKLLLQEHLIAGEFYFGVDTHDQMEIAPTFPDYEQWTTVRRFNGELKRRIEDAFAAAGLDTARTLRQAIVDGRRQGSAHGAGPCRGFVLVVDDEEDLAAAVAVLLERRGFRTWSVHDGRSGFEAARELLPDLVLLDYELPEMDGLQVLARLRAEPATSGIPVLLNTAARIGLEDIKKADGFLRKPYPESLLDEMLARLLKVREGRP
jgi:CheY-like chemotaxis protein